jgi:VanZ family protein
LKRLHASLIPAIGWFIISVILLTLPGTAFPQEDWLDKIWFDKWVHIGMFSIMVALWCIGWRYLKKNVPAGKFKPIFIRIGMICLGYGIAMEFVQHYFIPYRSFDVGDIIADVVGCAAGAVYSIRRYIKN